MKRLALVLLALVVLGGGSVYLAAQPAGDVQPIQPSAIAAATAAAKVVAAFKLAGLKAVLTRQEEPVTVNLSDLELTSIVDARLARGDTPVHDAVVHGTAAGVFQASALADWNGFTLHVSGAGAVTFASDGSLQLSVTEAKVGQLPVPAGLVNSMIAQAQSAGAVKLPAGILDLSLRAVDGGGVLSGSASPASV